MKMSIEISPAHVKFGDGHCDVIDGKPAFKEKILPHVRQRRSCVDCVAANPVSLQIRRRVSTLGKLEEGRKDLDERAMG